MGTAGAFLGYVEVLVEVNNSVRAGVNTALAAGALHRVDDNQAVISLVDGAFYGTCRDAGSLIAVHAENRDIVHLDLGYGAPDKLINNSPGYSSFLQQGKIYYGYILL